MSTEYKTPGVYIHEVNDQPIAVSSVDTTVPVFIGYTEKATRDGVSCIGKPIRISSMQQFSEVFGESFQHRFNIDIDTAASAGVQLFSPTMISDPPKRFYLFHCMQLFYANGGADCFVLSLGGFDGDDSVTKADKNDFARFDVFNQLAATQGPSLIVAPDFVVERESCYQLYSDILAFCATSRAYFAILDVIPESDGLSPSDTIQTFRNGVGETGRSYGAAYYPWLNATVVDSKQINLNHLNIYPPELRAILPEQPALEALDQYNSIPECDTSVEKEMKLNELHELLMQSSTVYQQIMEAVAGKLNLLPPGAAIAGVYATVDNTRGVWKAPANISLAGVKSTNTNLTNADQEHMNSDAVSGKSVNGIREFTGRGVLVWGARTLDGNHNEWRYINVRRTLMMIEQSLIKASRIWIFEPNDANTWVKMRGMVENYLYGLWKIGAFQGMKPSEGYHVKIGAGETMTAEDVQNGTLRILVMVALMRPAEFIYIHIVQQQQPS